MYSKGHEGRAVFEQAVTLIQTEADERLTTKNVVALLDEQEDLIQEIDHKGFTLLHHAARRRNGDLVLLLLDRGADPNAMTFNLESPLLLTAINESPLQLYQNISAETNTWRKALSAKADQQYSLAELVEGLAHEGKSQEAIKLFEANRGLVHAWYPPRGRLLHMITWRGRNALPVIRYMMKEGVDPNVLDSEGASALHYVMERPVCYADEVPDIIRLLVECGANINQRDWDGGTPLHGAAQSSNFEVTVKLLVELGADIHAEIGGTTALDILYEMKFLGGRSVANWLKTKGALSKKERKAKAKNGDPLPDRRS